MILFYLLGLLSRWWLIVVWGGITTYVWTCGILSTSLSLSLSSLFRLLNFFAKTLWVNSNTWIVLDYVEVCVIVEMVKIFDELDKIFGWHGNIVSLRTFIWRLGRQIMMMVHISEYWMWLKTILTKKLLVNIWRRSNMLIMKLWLGLLMLLQHVILLEKLIINWISIKILLNVFRK